MNWNESPVPPPFFVVVQGRRFRFGGDTLRLKGCGATMPRFVGEQAAEGRLVMVVERGNRFCFFPLRAWKSSPLSRCAHSVASRWRRC